MQMQESNDIVLCSSKYFFTTEVSFHHRLLCPFWKLQCGIILRLKFRWNFSNPPGLRSEICLGYVFALLWSIEHCFCVHIKSPIHFPYYINACVVLKYNFAIPQIWFMETHPQSEFRERVGMGDNPITTPWQLMVMQEQVKKNNNNKSCLKLLFSGYQCKQIQYVFLD